MKFIAAIVVYNEQDMLPGCLDELVDVLPVMVSISKPWEGTHTYFDLTKARALERDVILIENDFDSEREQRNYLMQKAQDDGYDYVFIIDADEYYTAESIQNAMKFIEQNSEIERFNISVCYTFWKNAEYELLPRFFNIIPVCYKSSMRFTGYRNIDTKSVLVMPENVICYHFSFAGSDDRILNKLTHFSHASEMSATWFENIWKKWTPEMTNIHPAADGHAFIQAIPFECPEDIRSRFNKYNHKKQMLKLDLGSGFQTMEGFTTIDIYQTGVVDIIHDIEKTLPFEDNIVDEIHSSHSLEHCVMSSVPLMLRDWHRILKIGGKIHIIVPEIEGCMRNFLDASEEDKWGYRIEYILGEHVSQVGQQLHKSAFTLFHLKKLVSEAKFDIVSAEVLHTGVNDTIDLIAYKR